MSSRTNAHNSTHQNPLHLLTGRLFSFSNFDRILQPKIRAKGPRVSAQRMTGTSESAGWFGRTRWWSQGSHQGASPIPVTLSPAHVQQRSPGGRAHSDQRPLCTGAVRSTKAWLLAISFERWDALMCCSGSSAKTAATRVKHSVSLLPCHRGAWHVFSFHVNDFPPVLRRCARLTSCMPRAQRRSYCSGSATHRASSRYSGPTR